MAIQNFSAVLVYKISPLRTRFNLFQSSKFGFLLPGWMARCRSCSLLSTSCAESLPPPPQELNYQDLLILPHKIASKSMCILTIATAALNLPHLDLCNVVIILCQCFPEILTAWYPWHTIFVIAH
jgi:hypothetical protein